MKKSAESLRWTTAECWGLGVLMRAWDARSKEWRYKLKNKDWKEACLCL
jgi:hypothetical protein